MPESKVYQIVSVQPQTYIDSGVPVMGYLIRAKWVNFEEHVELNSPSMDADLVHNRIMELFRQRTELHKLG